jgi:methyl-accepting chemotaxis protein
MTGIALGSVLVVRLILSIVPPLHRIIEATHRLQKGDLNAAIPYKNRADEIGQMAQALATFQQTARDKAALEEEQQAQKARAEAAKRAALAEVADNFQDHVGRVLEQLVQSIGRLRGSSHSMAERAKAASIQVATVASAAGQASGNVREVAEATEQLAGAINDIAQEVKRAQAVTERADGEAANTASMIHKLAESVTGIGEIVALINDIASQTNLLALNATIEAARAGEAGKGFAVVANEVKHLATQTGRATEDITRRIQAIQSGTAEAVDAMNRIAETITEMTGISGAVAQAIERQDQATGAIVRNVDDAAKGTAHVSQNIQAVGEASGQTGQTAGEISDAANELATEASRMRDAVDQFLHHIRQG